MLTLYGKNVRMIEKNEKLELTTEEMNNLHSNLMAGGTTSEEAEITIKNIAVIKNDKRKLAKNLLAGVFIASLSMAVYFTHKVF
ncbi:MAG: hypothetical protein GY714_29005 [Desulfobacterales bacterium]|nr:hypothetical protein [Desulfobacterales bacterium]MCP4163197.1 hypothetical protein [Deltaproteobacteria bacterium]